MEFRDKHERHEWILAFWDSAGRGSSRELAQRYADETIQFERELAELERAIVAAGPAVARHDLGELCHE
jgi:hypothetical protein